MPKRNAPGNPTLIDQQEQIDALYAECRAEGRFAFDTEFVMEDRFESEVCLIQIATESSVALIDPFLDLDLASIWGLVHDDQIETLVHAGQEDLALCVQHTGQVPRRVFDLQIAAGLVSTEYPVSLQKLVQSNMHIRLHKAKTLTDWRRRPLSSAQLCYGAEDVTHLLAIHRKLTRKLERLGRRDWAHAEFAKFEEMSLYRRAEQDKLCRVKGAGSLKAQELAVLQALLEWREGAARVLNRPPRTVLRDHLLVEIARTGISSPAEVRDLRGFNLSARNTQGLTNTIREALALPQDRWPRTIRRDSETPQETVLITLAAALLRGYCLDHQIAYGLVATKKSIRDLIRFYLDEQSDGGELARGWRGETAGALLREFLEGERMIGVNVRNGELRLTSDRTGARRHKDGDTTHSSD